MRGTIEKLIQTDNGGEALVKTASGTQVISVGRFYLCLPEWGQEEFEDRLKDYQQGQYSHPPIVVGDEVNFKEVDGELTITEILFKFYDPRETN